MEEAGPLTTIAFKLDSSIADHMSVQQEKIDQLEEQVKLLTMETTSQNDLISMLKKTNESLRKRILDLIKANEDIRGIVEAYLNIASQLRAKPVLTAEEKEILTSSDLARMVVRCNNIEISAKERQALKSGTDMTDALTLSQSPLSHEKESIAGVTVISMKRISHVVKSAAEAERSYEQQHPNMRLLIRFPLFAMFPPNVMEQVSLSSYEMHRAAGQEIVTKGNEGSEIFFLKQGEVSVVVDDNEITVLSPPIFFGEMGVLFKFQRTATVIAKTSSIMVVVTKQKLDEIISNSPDETKIRELVDQFSNNKEAWWKKQQYVLSQEKFGAEFSKDIVREDLKKLQIFSCAPDSFFDSLSVLVKCIAFEPGENIVTIGEDSNSIYFILSGTVEVIGTGGAVHAEILGGSSFGEVGVLLNIKRTASIRAKEQSFIFELEKIDVEKVLSDYPSVTGVLKTEAESRYNLFKQRTVQRFEEGSDFPDQFDMEVTFQSLSQLSIFAGIQAPVLAELAIKMIRKNWNAKEFIIKCGELGESMFFLAAGDVIVLTDFGDVLETVSGPSAYFGEVAILEQVPRTASVQCVTTCSTYELRKEDFIAVMTKYKEIGDRIKNTADERMQNYLMRSVLA